MLSQLNFTVILRKMIKVVSCGCYFDLVVHIKNVSSQISYGVISGSINLICEIICVRERLKRSFSGFVVIDNAGFDNWHAYAYFY